MTKETRANKELKKYNNKLKHQYRLLEIRESALRYKYEYLKKENEILIENAEHNDKVVDKVNWENMLLKKRINKAIEIYENRNSIEYKKKRFMEDKTIGYFMYEELKGVDKE